MATKRSAPDSAAGSSESHKRHKPSSFNHNHPTAPANLKSKLGKNSYKKAHPVNELKSQIRDIRRLLERADSGEKGLPATVRVEKERALRTAEQDLARAQAAKKRSDIIGRWHKVRFFERQKAERRLKKLKKEAKEEGGESKSLQKRIVEAQVDVNYAMYYPLDKDYLPLWPSKKAKEAAKKGEGKGSDATPEQEGEVEREGDAEMWQLVKQCMEDESLQDLREGRLTAGAVDSLKDESSENERHSKKSAKKKASQDEKPDKVLVKSKKDSRNTRPVVEVKDEGMDDKEQDGEDGRGTGFFE